MSSQALDLNKLRVYPLTWRKSMARISEILVDPDVPPPPCPPELREKVEACAQALITARQRGASRIMMFGAHLVKNGGASLLKLLMYNGWITHLAANGASAIHDWEFASHGASTESVRQNVAQGCFGAWLETGRFLNLAMLAGGLDNLGFGESVGRLILEDGVKLPETAELYRLLATEPTHPATPARAELLAAMQAHRLHGGLHAIKHPWKHNSIFAQACLQKVPITVHPGIGYDIITVHPMFNGGAIGRAAGIDFQVFTNSVARLNHGVVLSVGSAIMAPQVFEKSLSCVNNLRLQDRKKIIHDHHIFVVDIQDGGDWNWDLGEPPKENPAYYLRFMKSFSRMGGRMQYVQCDNTLFLHHLLWRLNEEQAEHE